ncbi:MAG: aminotransferase class V-fold PLP-dependent enzyme, partial [Clostridia bacterium]|nr:aminotransferase class V-fold PLP-dependent enzyme [Clostridia bacterium]
MIYLDNSATTFPKPETVRRSLYEAVRSGANPGRGGHPLSLKASESIFETRKTAAAFFGVGNETNVVFTLNCTMSLNIVIKGILKEGDHVVVSSLEHNSVMRPLEKLKNKGVSYTEAKVFAGDNDKTVNSFRNAINAKTRMIICTHASNVWGIRLPVERLTALAHEYGLLMAVDAAQSAGVVPIDFCNDGFDFLCVPGHKGLYGPMGTGLLILSDNHMPDSLIEGGTGSGSVYYEQPSVLPDRFESGTPNLYGIAALKNGMNFVSKRNIENIAKHEFRLVQHLYTELSRMNNVLLYTPMPEPGHFVPILSFNLKNKDSEMVAERLSRYG